jgi:hypothetical protein
MARWISLLGACVVLTACGASKQSPAPATIQVTVTSATASEANASVVKQAEEAPDAAAAAREASLRKTLTRRLGLNGELEWNLNHEAASPNSGASCYLKLGAAAVNEEEAQPTHILRGPNPGEVLFVQTNTVTPLVRCLKAVRAALGW